MITPRPSAPGLLRALACCIVFLGACAPIGPRLGVDATGAEFPFGGPVVVDGQIGAAEWVNARELGLNLPDGRSVAILLQRDGSSFYFAFTGLDASAPLEVHPEILFDLWANGGEGFDDNDWWFSVAHELCSQRGGHGEGDCGLVLSGWEANRFPLARGQAVEIAITFDAIGFSESYDGMLGLAFRFVDATGAQAAIWPLRGELRRPGTWAAISLRH